VSPRLRRPGRGPNPVLLQTAGTPTPPLAVFLRLRRPGRGPNPVLLQTAGTPTPPLAVFLTRGNACIARLVGLDSCPIVTRAEGRLPARSRREPRRRSPRLSIRAIGLASIGATLIAAAVLPLLPPGQGLLAQTAGADPLSSAQAEATQLAAEIQAEGQQLEILSQRYDAAEQQVQQLTSQMSQIEAQITVTKKRVVTAQAKLRQQALYAYMNGTELGIEDLFTGDGPQETLATEYRSVAAGRLSTAIDSLHVAQAALSTQRTQLQTTESHAQAAATEAYSAQASAQSTEEQQTQTLNQVKGQIAVLVAQQEAAEAAAQEAAFQARVAAAAAQTRAEAADQASSSGGGSGATSAGPDGAGTDVPVSPGGAGAVQAAQTQLGVPYVWGGEEPGVGFDCSGLTQWAWRQAGVDIPRTAQEQYDAITHVSLSDLQPGDLLFWNDGTSSVQHVAMYVGGDTVIQAPETGETVSYATIWNSGLVGAGRP
jgi:cell wall-associated NlpC family hydrolase